LQKENDKLRRDLAKASMPETDAGGVIAVLRKTTGAKCMLSLGQHVLKHALLAAEEELEELKEEFQARLGAADRTIATLQVLTGDKQHPASRPVWQVMYRAGI
jgi:hypothetical protein